MDVVNRRLALSRAWLDDVRLPPVAASVSSLTYAGRHDAPSRDSLRIVIQRTIRSVSVA